MHQPMQREVICTATTAVTRLMPQLAYACDMSVAQYQGRELLNMARGKVVHEKQSIKEAITATSSNS